MTIRIFSFICSSSSYTNLLLSLILLANSPQTSLLSSNLWVVCRELWNRTSWCWLVDCSDLAHCSVILAARVDFPDPEGADTRVVLDLGRVSSSMEVVKLPSFFFFS